jgi:Uma2 family endonuclease
MSQTISVPPPGRQSVLLSNVDWKTYTRLLRLFAERPGIRLTYDDGELEIMSPTLEHDDEGSLLGDFVFMLTLELGLPLKRGGSVTMRQKKKQKGIESDECFWITNAHRMAAKKRLDLRSDPPPDLAIEIDVTSSSLDRMAIYAALKVPELWRLEGNVLTFHVLQPDGTYQSVERSLAFPLLTPGDLLLFIQQAREAGDENVVMRRFRDWIRLRAAGAEGSSGEQ